MLCREVPTYFAQLRDRYRVELVGRHDLQTGGAPGSVRRHPPAHQRLRLHPRDRDRRCLFVRQAPEHGILAYTAMLERYGKLEAYSEDYFKRRDNGWYFGSGSYDSILRMELHQDVFITDLAVGSST